MKMRNEIPPDFERALNAKPLKEELRELETAEHKESLRRVRQKKNIEAIEKEEYREAKTQESLQKEKAERAAEDAHSIEAVKNEKKRQKLKISEKLLEETRTAIKEKDRREERTTKPEAFFAKPAWEKKRTEEAPKGKNLKQKIKDVMLRLFGVAILSGAAKEGTAALSSDSTDKKPKKIENIKGYAKDSTEKSISIYTKARTKEGGITPTGKSNSFYENKSGLTEQDLFVIAEKYGFPTKSNYEAQSAMIDYLEAHHPEIITETLKEFGTTANQEKITGDKKDLTRQEMILGLKDGIFGARTAFMLEKFIEVDKDTPISKEHKEDTEQPKGGYVINVRGDENNSEGVYFFFENEKDFLKATDEIGGYSSREVYADGTGQASVNMSAAVYKEFHSDKKGKSKILGQGWLLADNNDGKKRYKKLNATINFSDGLATK